MSYTRKAVHIFDSKIFVAVHEFHLEIFKGVDKLPFPASFWGGCDNFHIEVFKACDNFDPKIFKRIHNFYFPI